MTRRTDSACELVAAAHDDTEIEDDGEALITAENALADWLALGSRSEGAQHASALIRAAVHVNRERRGRP